MRKIILIVVGVALISSCFSQGTKFAWASKCVGSSTEQGVGITTDINGNVITTGFFQGNVDFDMTIGTSILTSIVSSSDIFIQKLDTNSNLIWAKSIGGAGADQGNSVVTDFAGNVYITGTFSDTVDFNPSPLPADTAYHISVGGPDIFILKLDVNGNFLWVATMGGFATDNGNEITVDPFGNVLVSGYFYGTVDFDPTAGVLNLVSIGSNDGFVVKYDSNGNFIWVKGIGQTGQDEAEKITTDVSGNIFITGYAGGNVDFDPGPGVNTIFANGPFILKLDNNGNFIWVKVLNGPGLSGTSKIIVGANGDFYLAGSFWGTCDFDPGAGVLNIPSNGGAFDMFIEKFDSIGNMVWVRTFGSTADDVAYGMALDPSGDLTICGKFSLTVDFDPGPAEFNLTSNGGCDIFLLKLENNGNFIYAKQIGESGNDYCVSLAEDTAGNIYSTGTMYASGGSSVDFDPSPLSVYNIPGSNSWDMFVFKMNSCGPLSTSNFSLAVCNNYSLNGQTITNPGLYSFGLTNAAGCDSILTVSLTINQGTSNSISLFICDSLNFNGQTYTNSGSYIQHLATWQGCDSMLTLNLTLSLVSPVVTPMQWAGIPGIASVNSASNTFFQWMVCTNGFDTIAGITTSGIWPGFNGSFAVYSTDAISGCAVLSPCTPFNLVKDVWPGDANYDSIVDNSDLLPIGLYYGQAGMARSVQGNLWQADTANNWWTFQTNGADIKHANCNGDTIIDANDTLAVNLNFNSIHAIGASPNDYQEKTNAPNIYFITNQNSYNAGDMVDVEVWAGSSLTFVNNFYGLSFNINYTTSLVQPGTESLTYPASWIGTPGTNVIKISKIDALANTAYGGITRINHTSTGGYGKIADFKFQANTNITSASQFNLSISGYKANDASGAPVVFNTINDTLLFVQSGAGISEINTIGGIIISPNPFTSQTIITFNEEQKNTRLLITDVLGNVIQQSTINSHQTTIDMSGQAKGVYFLKVHSEKGILTKKIVKE